MEISIWTWDKLLQFVGEKLEINKSVWYIIEYKFDHKKLPITKQ